MTWGWFTLGVLAGSVATGVGVYIYVRHTLKRMNW